MIAEEELGLTVYIAPTIERELRGMSRAQKREPLAIVQEVQQTDIIVVNQNLEQLAAQQQVIEQEFAALVQAEVALVTQLDTIKNNIRVNHFKARFSQVVSHGSHYTQYRFVPRLIAIEHCHCDSTDSGGPAPKECRQQIHGQAAAG